MGEVAEELAKYVPRELQPKLVHVEDCDECILVGVLTRCLKGKKEVVSCFAGALALGDVYLAQPSSMLDQLIAPFRCKMAEEVAAGSAAHHDWRPNTCTSRI